MEVCNERTEAPAPLVIVWDQLVRPAVVEDAMEVDEVARLVAIAYGVKCPRAHVPIRGNGHSFAGGNRW